MIAFVKGQGTLAKREHTNNLCDSPRGLVPKPTYHTFDAANFLIFYKKSHRFLGYSTCQHFWGKVITVLMLSRLENDQREAFNLSHASSGDSTDWSSFVSQSKIRL